MENENNNLSKRKKNEEKKEIRIYKHHIRFWKFIRVVAKPVIKLLFKFEYEIAPTINGPYLVVSNHTTDLDPAFLGISFPPQMYFVASEHVYRSGILGTFLKWAFEPIAKIKGSSDATTVLKMLRYLRSGKNVCLFPEGNRSFNGKTGNIIESTGKLVKASNASLVTYKITGGYFATPRWGKGIRKGKVTGKVVKVYSPEEIKKMEPEEITSLIKADLWENAYETQAKNPIKYKGKTLAESFETGYNVCPKCKTIDNITSKKNKILCKNCGMETILDEYGYFPKDFDFKTVEDWDNFQEDFYKNLVSQTKDNTDSLFFDSDVELCIFNNQHIETSQGIGIFKMFTDRFVFETDSKSIELPLSEIPEVSIHGKKTLIFTSSGNIHYELKSKNIVNVRKYLSCFYALKNV